MTSESLDLVISATIEKFPDMVNRWLEGQPGSWGFLAGQAVIAYRDRLGRSLADQERRQVWDALWRRLNEVKNTPQKTGLRRERPDTTGKLRPDDRRSEQR
jgi:hypothetical protein